MVKREAVVYLYLGILILGALLAVYFFNLQLTGFAVFQQSNQAAFDEGTYENVEYDVNDSIIILSANQTSGTYTSKIFDANGSATWNNLTWTGTGDLEFEVRSCSSADCSNSSFASGDLNNLNLPGQYFQYRVLFDINISNETLALASVSLDYSALVIETETLTISISQPSGTKDSTSGPIQFSITGGENYKCWYNVLDNLDSSVILGNTSIASCSNDTNTTFSGIGDGDYTFNLYVNSSLGLYHDSSSFSVSPSEEEEEEEEETESTTQIPVQPSEQQAQNIVDLSLQSIEPSTINPSDSRNYNLIATNTGNVPLSACALSAGGNFVSWLSVPGDAQNINAGEGKNFAFSMNVPEGTEEGNYVFSLSVQCSEILRNSEFSVDVVKKRIEFNITGAERTRTDRVVVTYSLDELLNEEQTVVLQFFLYDAGNQEVGNASANQTLSAGESDEFSTNIAINESLEGNVSLSANLNSQQYSVSVREPITLGAPTGFFVFGDNFGTTGNVLAIIILIVGVVVIFFFLKRKKISKKINVQ